MMMICPRTYKFESFSTIPKGDQMNIYDEERLKFSRLNPIRSAFRINETWMKGEDNE